MSADLMIVTTDASPLTAGPWFCEPPKVFQTRDLTTTDLLLRPARIVLDRVHVFVVFERFQMSDDFCRLT